jgi:hypothetical protein
MKINRRLQQPLATGSIDVAQKDTNPIYVQHTTVYDAKHLPPSAEDLYAVKVEISNLREVLSDVLACNKYAGRFPWRKAKVVRSRRKHAYSLPEDLSHISMAIEESKEMVSRPQDTSNEIETVCGQQTWQRAVVILAAHVKKVWMYARVKVKAPVISPGPKSSVDIYWLPSPYGLLLNVPANLEEPVTYYGDDAENPDSNHTSGKIQPPQKIDPGVLAWLAHMGEKRSKAGR